MKKNVLIVVALLNALSICRISPATPRSKPQKPASITSNNQKDTSSKPVGKKQRRRGGLKSGVKIKNIQGATDIFDEVNISAGKQIFVNAILKGETIGYAKLADGDSQCTLLLGKPVKRAGDNKAAAKTGSTTETPTTEVPKVEIGKLTFSAPLKIEDLKKKAKESSEATLDITAKFEPKAASSTPLAPTSTPASTTPQTTSAPKRTIK